MDLHFAEKCIIFVLAKRRMPINKGFSPLFLYENGRKNHCFTKHLENLYAEADFLNAFAEFFRAKLVRELTI